MLKVTGPKVTMACQDDHLFAGLKVGIDGAVHGVQAIWDENLTTDNWGFLLVYAKNAFNRVNQIGMPWTVRYLWLSGARFSLIAVVTGYYSFCGTETGRQFFCIVRRARCRGILSQ